MKTADPSVLDLSRADDSLDLSGSEENEGKTPASFLRLAKQVAEEEVKKVKMMWKSQGKEQTPAK